LLVYFGLKTAAPQGLGWFLGGLGEEEFAFLRDARLRNTYRL
jgi:hypothetical protein